MFSFGDVTIMHALGDSLFITANSCFVGFVSESLVECLINQLPGNFGLIDSVVMYSNSVSLVCWEDEYSY